MPDRRRIFDLSKVSSGSDDPLERIERSEVRDSPLAQAMPSALEGIAIRSAKISPESRIVAHTLPQGLGADRYRYLRLRLREYRKSRKLQSLTITSPLPLDGKSTTALNLSTSLAEGGRRSVLCIEADLYHPSLASTLGIEAPRGLADCVRESLDPLSVIMKIDPLGWYLMPAGSLEGSPTELLQSDRLQTVLDALLPHFDWVILDAPPILALTDGALLSTQTDGTLLVARADRTPRESIEEALRLIGKKKTVGLVLNGADDVDRVYGKYYGSYYRDHSKTQ